MIPSSAASGHRRPAISWQAQHDMRRGRASTDLGWRNWVPSILWSWSGLASSLTPATCSGCCWISWIGASSGSSTVGLRYDSFSPPRPRARRHAI